MQIAPSNTPQVGKEAEHDPPCRKEAGHSTPQGVRPTAGAARARIPHLESQGAFPHEFVLMAVFTNTLFISLSSCNHIRRTHVMNWKPHLAIAVASLPGHSTGMEASAIGSLMCGGSSGGPWLVNFGIRPARTATTAGSASNPNIVVGTTSWGYVSTAPKQQGARGVDERNNVPARQCRVR